MSGANNTSLRCPSDLFPHMEVILSVFTALLLNLKFKSLAYQMLEKNYFKKQNNNTHTQRERERRNARQRSRTGC